MTRPDPAEHVVWCSLGCGIETSADRIDEGKCPKCGEPVADLGWRYLNSHGVTQYASAWDTLPPDVRKASAA